MLKWMGLLLLGLILVEEKEGEGMRMMETRASSCPNLGA